MRVSAWQFMAPMCLRILIEEFKMLQLEQERRVFEERLNRESVKRERRAFWAFLFVGVVGLILAVAQVWTQLRPTRVIVEFPSFSQPPAPDTPSVQPPTTSGGYPGIGKDSPVD